MKRLKGIPGIVVNDIQLNTISNYAYFPVLFDKNIFGKSRDEVFDMLARENIFARKYFYPLINEYDCYKDKYFQLCFKLLVIHIKITSKVQLYFTILMN